MNKGALIYAVLIGLTAAIAFLQDKRAAVRGRERVPERTLHLLEALGGAWAVLPLMYLIRHKNRKPRYYLWTWMWAAAWITGIVIAL